jgi:hypothetical protein
MNIYQRINAVMKSVSYLKKDTHIKGAGQDYKAASHDAVVAALRVPMVENGIVVQVEQLKGEMLQMRDLKADRKMHLYSGDYAIHFVNIDKPEDRCTVTINAHAADNGDKSPGKCASYATKVAMLKTFSLETGEDDESRGYEAPAFTDIQKAEFDRILDREDGTAFAVFNRKVGPDVMLGLTKTFPDGKKSQGKALCKRLDGEGWKVLRDYGEQIGSCVDRDDSHGIMELVESLSDDEKRVLAGILRPEDITAINRAKDL